MKSTDETSGMFKEGASLFAKGKYEESIEAFSETIKTDRAEPDMEMVRRLTEKNLQSFSAENNVWRFDDSP